MTEELAGGKLLLDEHAEAVARLTLNHPDSRNALNHELLAAFPDIIKTFAEYMKDQLRAVGIDMGMRASPDFPTYVSRVSNGYECVTEQTRRQVLDAMRELGYRPNSAARALKRGEFRTLGVITFSLSSTGNVRTLEAIANSAAARETC